MKTLLLSAPEIHCEACKKILRMAFGDLRTIDNVQIDVGTKRIQCDYDEAQITEENIIVHLEEETSFKIKKVTKDE
ncbi:MAG: hypothetical protein PHH16_00450 [Candidatus Gracilibacteria bacterium]|nr:hypothetical protein [Candidatus Gracilibacteria bacterium]